MSRFNKHKWWMLTVVLTAPAIAIAAGVTHVFAPRTPIISDHVNQNFRELSDRIAKLEEARPFRAHLVMDNVTGPLPKSATVVVTAGPAAPLLLTVSGSAYWTTANTNSVMVKFDGKELGEVRSFTNEGSSHKAAVTRWFLVPAAAALPGNHVIELVTGTGTASTLTDASDYFNVTAFELPSR